MRVWVSLTLLPTFRGRKNRFSSYLTKLNSNILTERSHKKFLKSFKAPKLFRKTQFQIKFNKSGMCHNLGPERIPWGRFRGNRSSWDSFFNFFLFTSLFEKIHTQKLFAHGNLKIFAHGKIKRGRKFLVKKIKTKTKTKKKQAQRRKEKYHSVEKRKHFLRESDWY